MCPLVVLVLLKLRWDPSFTASAAPAEFQMLDSLRMSILRLSCVRARRSGRIIESHLILCGSL